MKSAGGFFSSFITKGKKLLKDSQKVVSETKAKLNDEIAAISHKVSNLMQYFNYMLNSSFMNLGNRWSQ